MLLLLKLEASVWLPEMKNPQQLPLQSQLTPLHPQQLQPQQLIPSQQLPPQQLQVKKAISNATNLHISAFITAWSVFKSSFKIVIELFLVGSKNLKYLQNISDSISNVGFTVFGDFEP